MSTAKWQNIAGSKKIFNLVQSSKKSRLWRLSGCASVNAQASDRNTRGVIGEVVIVVVSLNLKFEGGSGNVNAIESCMQIVNAFLFGHKTNSVFTFEKGEIKKKFVKSQCMMSTREGKNLIVGIDV